MSGTVLKLKCVSSKGSPFTAVILGISSTTARSRENDFNNLMSMASYVDRRQLRFVLSVGELYQRQTFQGERVTA